MGGLGGVETREAGRGVGTGGAVAENRWLMRAVVVATPMGFIATEAGWMTTELGRQPWVIQGVLRTRDAVTPMPGLVVPFVRSRCSTAFSA